MLIERSQLCKRSAASAEWRGTTRQTGCQQWRSGEDPSVTGPGDTMSASRCSCGSPLGCGVVCASHSLPLHPLASRMDALQTAAARTDRCVGGTKQSCACTRTEDTSAQGMHHVWRASTWYRMTPMLQQSDRCLSTSFLFSSTSGAAGAWQQSSEVCLSWVSTKADRVIQAGQRHLGCQGTPMHARCM